MVAQPNVKICHYFTLDVTKCDRPVFVFLVISKDNVKKVVYYITLVLRLQLVSLVVGIVLIEEHQCNHFFISEKLYGVSCSTDGRR